MQELSLNRQPTQERYKVYTDLHALNDLKVQARNDQKAALKPVAQQFESIFIEQILKQARKVKLDDGWLDGKQTQFFKDMYDKQLAQELSTKETLGLADMIVEQLATQHPVMTKSQYEAFKAEKQNAASAQATGDDTTDTQTQLTQDHLANRAILK
jgi:flagellar protein FlgJ